jgi:hypothetical protein
MKQGLSNLRSRLLHAATAAALASTGLDVACCGEDGPGHLCISSFTRIPQRRPLGNPTPSAESALPQMSTAVDGPVIKP